MAKKARAKTAPGKVVRPDEAERQAGAAKTTPPSYTSVTLPRRGKRQELTIELPQRITTSTRSTIFASTTRATTTIRRQHHALSIRPPSPLPADSTIENSFPRHLNHNP